MKVTQHHLSGKRKEIDIERPKTIEQKALELQGYLGFRFELKIMDDWKVQVTCIDADDDISLEEKCINPKLKKVIDKSVRTLHKFYKEVIKNAKKELVK